MKLLTKLQLFTLLFALFAMTTSAKEFSYVETFDDDASFVESADLPDGWVANAPQNRLNAMQAPILAPAPIRAIMFWEHSTLQLWDVTVGFSPKCCHSRGCNLHHQLLAQDAWRCSGSI